MADITLNERVVIPESVVSRDLGGETVVLNLETGIYFDLNEVATDAWQAIQATPSLAAVFERLSGLYDVDSSVLSADLLRLVEQLTTKGLLQIEGPSHAGELQRTRP